VGYLLPVPRLKSLFVTSSAFLAAINPVYKLCVLEALLGIDAWYFEVDETRFPG
jgi:hypothetical protein